MPKGFFAKSLLLSSKKPLSRVPKCGACKLYLTCKSPKMEVSGKGAKGILVVAEAPGKEEDKQGIQLVGNSGTELMNSLRRFGIDMREDCWLTNSLICRPPGNANPTDDQITYCHPNLLNTLERLKPKVIITLGKYGAKSTLYGLYKDKVEAIKPWAGWQIPHQKLNAWICPTFHPAYILHEKSEQQQKLIKSYFKRHLEAAVAHTKRPWKVAPDYTKQVEKVIDPAKAAKIIREFIRQGGNGAYDYETTMLKPDSDRAIIVSCSICHNGERTIAYPFFGEAVAATYEYIRSGIGLIASNLQFEERWNIKQWGRGGRRWLWDTMNNAHVADCREGITSIKFQSFVRLGIETYDAHIQSLLHAKRGKVNQIIKEIDLDQLLLYNGLDSLLEYCVAQLQMEELDNVADNWTFVPSGNLPRSYSKESL
jgi:uracil-DNA glycosylase family 4